MPTKDSLGIPEAPAGVEIDETRSEDSLGPGDRFTSNEFGSDGSAPDIPGVTGDSRYVGDFIDPILRLGIDDQAATDMESIIEEYGLPALTNGEREYVCALNLDFEDPGLISNFDFGWRLIREEDYDVETGFIRAGTTTFSQNDYNDIINADYETGITPLRLQYFSEAEENNYFFSWEHGNATRPIFGRTTTAADEYGVDYGDAYSVSYESDELAMLSDKFSKDDFGTAIENAIQTIANNVYNRLNITTNLNLEFNKNKSKEIKFKKLSRFEAQQTQDEQTETTGGSRSGLGSGTSGGAY